MRRWSGHPPSTSSAQSPPTTLGLPSLETIPSLQHFGTYTYLLQTVARHKYRNSRCPRLLETEYWIQLHLQCNQQSTPNCGVFALRFATIYISGSGYERILLDRKRHAANDCFPAGCWEHRHFNGNIRFTRWKHGDIPVSYAIQWQPTVCRVLQLYGRGWQRKYHAVSCFRNRECKYLSDYSLRHCGLQRGNVEFIMRKR